MGCCTSREAGDGGEPPARHAGDASESRTNITRGSPHRPASAASTPHSHPRPQKSSAPNQPLVRLDPKRRVALPDPLTLPTSTSSQNPGTTPWTRAKLNQERNDWWNTRVTGNPDVWLGYRQMVEHVQNGEVQEAQALLDALGCTCPSGKLWHSIFDPKGVEYAIRDARRNNDWIVFEPRGLAPDGDAAGQAGPGNAGPWLDGQDDTTMTEDKGKGRAPETFRVKCRLSDNRDCFVEIQKGEPIASLQKKVAAFTGLDAERHKISYLGQVYHKSETLPTKCYDAWQAGQVLQIFI